MYLCHTRESFRFYSTLTIRNQRDPIRFQILLERDTQNGQPKYLFTIFQKSLQSAAIPDDWKMAKVIPILKSGDACSVMNYRPISLTSSCCKLLEHIVSKHIKSFLATHSLLNDKQHGFRKGLSTVTQLTGIVHFISCVLDARGQVDCIFLDFQKAFDHHEKP